MSHRRSSAAIGATSALLGALALAPTAQAATPCAGTFRVQHNDRIGSLQLPKGNYRIRVSRAVSCPSSTSLFAAFLQHYDGVLPQGWTYKVRGRGWGRFVRPGSKQAFTVRRTRKGGGGLPPAPDLVCAGSFQVLHNDTIGELNVPAGNYRLTRLSALSPTCDRASTLFASFLQRPDGNLPGGWIVLPADGAFVKGSIHYGFHIERLR